MDNKRKIKATPIPFTNSMAIHWEDEENVTEVLATTENAEFAEAMVELFNEYEYHNPEHISTHVSKKNGRIIMRVYDTTPNEDVTRLFNCIKIL